MEIKVCPTSGVVIPDQAVDELGVG